jgi:peroxiredoxin Q/BCP
MFEAAGCTILGVSFDTPADNKTFKSSQDFPFDLLSDESREIGTAYGAIRDADDPYADYPKRVSYLIDPTGAIAKTYEVSDPAGHAVQVLSDLDAAQR